MTDYTACEEHETFWASCPACAAITREVRSRARMVTQLAGADGVIASVHILTDGSHTLQLQSESGATIACLRFTLDRESRRALIDGLREGSPNWGAGLPEGEPENACHEDDDGNMWRRRANGWAPT